MLEVLPPGASKGNGVEILLKHLGVDPTRLVALGTYKRMLAECLVAASIL